jgi:hypothetical protein
MRTDVATATIPDAGLEAGQAHVQAVQDQILTHGLDAERALALADALEGAGRLVDAVDALVVANRLRRDVATERRLVRLRAAAFGQLSAALAPSQWPHFEVDGVAPQTDGPLEVPAAELSATVMRDGLYRRGHLLVRGLIPRARVERLRHCIDETFRAHDEVARSGTTPATQPWCDPFEGIPDAAAHRLMVRASHGILAADSPRALHEYLETLESAGVRNLVAAYLGERPALSVMKCTLRRADPSDWRIRLSNWHQDGAFLGHGIRTVNVWVALSKCGEDAPGMELMPCRLTGLISRGGDGAEFDWTVSPQTIAREIPGVPIWRPTFDEGDVLMFDHWSLHRTAADERMSKLRYAVESWFFAPSAYPADSPTMLVV